MKQDELTQFITNAAEAIKKSEKFAVALLAGRAKRAAELNREDVCLVQAAGVLEKMAVNGKTFISRAEFNKLYDGLYTRNSKFAEFFKDELGEKKQQRIATMTRSADDGISITEEAYKSVSDPVLVNALSQVFEDNGSYKVYSEDTAKQAEASCMKELNSIGAPPKSVKVFAGQSDIIICQATYETPRGNSEMLVPVEVADGKALLPNMFLGRAGFMDLKTQDIHNHITQTAGKSYRVDGETLLQALSGAKNGFATPTSDVELAVMRLRANQETPASYSNDGIVYQSVEQPVAPVQDIKYKTDPEIETFAKSLASPKGIAGHMFGQKNIQAANNVIMRKLATWGFKNAQVAVEDVTETTIVYAVSLAGNAGFRVPVRVNNGNIVEPEVVMATGKVYEFSKYGVNEIFNAKEKDSRAIATASPSYELKTSDLIGQVKEAMDDNNYAKAEDALNVLASRDDRVAYQAAFAAYMSALNMKNPLAKQAAKLEEDALQTPLLIDYKVFL